MHFHNRTTFRLSVLRMCTLTPPHGTFRLQLFHLFSHIVDDLIYQSLCSPNKSLTPNLDFTRRIAITPTAHTYVFFILPLHSSAPYESNSISSMQDQHSFGDSSTRRLLYHPYRHPHPPQSEIHHYHSCCLDRHLNRHSADPSSGLHSLYR